MIEIIKQLLSGFGLNMLLFFTTLLGGIPLGLLVMFGCRAKIKPVSWIFKLLVWVVRGTPLMLQLMAVYFLPSLLFGHTFSRVMAAVIAFVVNYACYFAEIYRGGLESIPRGQYEAGQVLGMTRSQIFFRVVLMQVVKRIVPPMGNEVITLIKDTSLANIIAVAEIIMTSQRYLAKGILWPFFSTAIYFLLFNGIVTVLLSRLEKKLDYYKA